MHVFGLEGVVRADFFWLKIGLVECTFRGYKSERSVVTDWMLLVLQITYGTPIEPILCGEEDFDPVEGTEDSEVAEEFAQKHPECHRYYAGFEQTKCNGKEVTYTREED